MRSESGCYGRASLGKYKISVNFVYMKHEEDDEIVVLIGVKRSLNGTFQLGFRG